MNFLEKDLETIIFNTPASHLSERGLHIYNKRKRQLRVGNYGIADLVSIGLESEGPFPMFPRYLCIKVFELKQDKIDIHTFLQAIRYVKGIKRWIEVHKQSLFFKDVRYQIYLVGKTLDTSSSLAYFPELISNTSMDGGLDVNILTYSYEFDGIAFKNEFGYKLINEGF